MANAVREAYKKSVGKEAEVRSRAQRVAIVLLALSAFAAAPFEGSWRLVRQTYEAGGWNLAPDDAPVRLEIAHGAEGLRARIWAGNDSGRALEWPAYANDEGPLEVEIVSRGLTPRGGIEARYRVRPSPEDDLVLEITETYEPTEDGDALEGTMTVRFTGGATNRGGYTLHRRFERER